MKRSVRCRNKKCEVKCSPIVWLLHNLTPWLLCACGPDLPLLLLHCKVFLHMQASRCGGLVVMVCERLKQLFI